MNKITLIKSICSCAFCAFLSGMPSSLFAYGYETANWKGAYVTCIKGGDGSLAAGLDGTYLTGDSKWGSYVIPNEMLFDFETSQVLTKYNFATITWLAGAISRSPLSWKLVASNDLSNWDILDQHSDGNEKFTKERQLVEFTFSNTKSYKYYKFLFEKPISGNMFGLASVEFPEFKGNTKPYFPKNDMTVVKEQLVKEKEIVRASNNEIVITASVYSNDIPQAGAVYCTSEEEPTLETASKVTGSFSATSVFGANITDLLPNTTYYVRPYATNETGTSYGATYVVTTSDKEGDIFTTSLIKTNDELNIWSDRATFSVSISDAATGITQRGVVWCENGSVPTIDSKDKYVDSQSGTGKYDAKLSNLIPNTLYTMRPYAIINDNVCYGAEYIFNSRAIETTIWKNNILVTTDLTDDSYKWRGFIENAFDGNLSTKFGAYNQNTYLLFTLPVPDALNKYELANVDDDKRYPKNWTIKASNDNENWTVLHSVENNVWNSKREKQSFNFTNNTKYKYYRLDVTKNNNGNRTEISHIDFPLLTNNEKIAVEKIESVAFVNENNNIVVKSNNTLDARVMIFNSFGQNVYSSIINSDIHIVDKNFSNGVYIVRIISNSNDYASKVFVK